MSKEYVYITRENDKIHVTTFGNDNLENKNCIIFVHGFKGFKDWGFGPYLANYFADKGFFVITFNFSHNGIGTSPTEFTELDKFAENTYSRELNELSELIFSYRNNFFGKINNTKIGLLGHSRGGAISLLSAYRENEISAVALWSSISTFDRYSERQKTEWREKGFFEVLNTRTNQMMRLNLSLLEDIEKNGSELLNIEKAISGMQKKLLIVHGEQDLAVPVKEAEQMYEWSNKAFAEYFIIKNTGHTFDIKHPFEGSNDKFERVLSTTENFFRRNLN